MRNRKPTRHYPIAATPGYCSGEPRFQGTRVPLYLIRNAIYNGWTREQMLHMWPTINPDDLDWWLRHQDEPMVMVPESHIRETP